MKRVRLFSLAGRKLSPSQKRGISLTRASASARTDARSGALCEAFRLSLLGSCLYVAGDNWHTLFLRRRMPADSTSGATGCPTLGGWSFHWDWPLRRWSHSRLRLLWLINDSGRKVVLSTLQTEAMRWFQKGVNPRNAILGFLMLPDRDQWRVRGVRGLSMVRRYLYRPI